jgi:hypothetical protein
MLSGPGGAALAYDPVGRLSQSSSTTLGATRFGYDGTELVAEYSATGTLLRREVYLEPVEGSTGHGINAKSVLERCPGIGIKGVELGRRGWDDQGRRRGGLGLRDLRFCAD